MNAPTNATQAKERLYAQLATSFKRMNRTMSQNADLWEQMQVDLHSMRTFAGLDAARFMTIASSLNPEEPEVIDAQRSSEEKS
ncbi:hypothetical protein E1B28_007458 [Marasmius oreades]|uniref:Uncharacterized protein n=1 Tax=Marasmius oreades TaxID=181124 RepID=A0A9P7S2E3_9AGAR|nr:uncharacterized protein E1B28_007458 [Marasmius oreades]KAG7093817.1 hypothetical protein E1B28_007458 [Marasmius oreades]